MPLQRQRSGCSAKRKEWIWLGERLTGELAYITNTLHTHIIDRCSDAARAIGPRSTARLEPRILRRPAGLGVVVDPDPIAPIGNPGHQGAFRCHSLASAPMGAMEARRSARVRTGAGRGGGAGAEPTGHPARRSDPAMILLDTNTCSAAQGPHREAFID